MLATKQRFGYRVREIGARGATYPSAIQHDVLHVHVREARPIEGQVGEFVDDDQAVAEARIAEQAIEQRGFPRTEVTGKERERQGGIARTS